MRTQLINHLIETYNYKDYLEIGLGNPEKNFNYIEVGLKESVDPKGSATYRMKSDNFFKKNKKTYDLIFIDGLHLHNQVLRDVYNSLKILNEGGMIVMHDTNPKREVVQRIDYIKGAWTGDVWKAFVWLRMTREDLFMETVNIETGCSLIYPGSQELITKQENLSYEDLEENRQEWLNLITWNQFLNKYQ